jgi:hypothetical protein
VRGQWDPQKKKRKKKEHFNKYQNNKVGLKVDLIKGGENVIRELNLSNCCVSLGGNTNRKPSNALFTQWGVEHTMGPKLFLQSHRAAASNNHSQKKGRVGVS